MSSFGVNGELENIKLWFKKINESELCGFTWW